MWHMAISKISWKDKWENFEKNSVYSQLIIKIKKQ